MIPTKGQGILPFVFVVDQFTRSLTLTSKIEICIFNQPFRCGGTSREASHFLDVSAWSDFPNEHECLVFGDRFEFEDLYLGQQSLSDQLDVLKLYYKLIRGRWYTQNKQQFKKRNQREIIKLIRSMMTGNSEGNDNENGQNSKKSENYLRGEYVQKTFESMTRNLRKNVVWINRNGMESLLPELKQLFHDEFVQYLRVQHNIKTQYGEVVVLEMMKDDIVVSSRENAIYSKEIQHPVNMVNGRNISDLTLLFRCYRKMDVNNPNGDSMVLKGEFMVKPFSNRIGTIRVSGGIWFPQIAFQKWDFCTFSARKLTKGASLFSLDKLDKIGDKVPVIAKICFQIKEIAPKKQ